MENRVQKIQTKSSRGSPFGWLFTWRMARRTLIGLAGLATLIAIFYTVENLRGNRAWENCKRELEAKGAALDWNAYIPPAVPTDQNFFDAPKMAEWFIKRPHGQNTNELRQRLEQFNTNTTLEIATEAAARDFLAASDQNEPEFDLIREALKRPYSRMPGDYLQPYAMPIPDFVTVRTLVQALSQRTKCALLIGQPEKAVRDLTLMHDLCRLLESRPTGKPITLVAAMINVSVTGLYVETLAHGIRLQAWREPELATLQEQLQQLDLLPLVESAYGCERAAVCRILETASPKELRKIFSSSGKAKNLWEEINDSRFLLLTIAPRGWIYQNNVTDANLLQKALESYDLPNRVILPEKANRAFTEIEKIVRKSSPYTFLASFAIPNSRKGAQVATRNQTMANQAQIVCALERYRLALGTYPETLDLLMPKFIKNLPNDIIGGQPLKYRRTDDGEFVLYSIGWDEKDEDGTPGKTLNDNDHGDWVWQDNVRKTN
jgi:hypothetical protein